MRNERPCEAKQADTPVSSTYRNAGWSVAAVLARAAKKYYLLREPQRASGVEIFFSCLFYPCKYVFVEQRKRLTNTLLPAIFNLSNLLLFGFLME